MENLKNKTNQELIDEILDNFEFEKVHKVMTFLDWRWVGVLPDVADLRAQARKLLKECLKFRGEKPRHIETGGFMAEYNLEEEDGYELLTLSFILNSWEVDNDV